MDFLVSGRCVCVCVCVCDWNQDLLTRGKLMIQTLYFCHSLQTSLEYKVLKNYLFKDQNECGYISIEETWMGSFHLLFPISCV